jgi:hypothetical protein
MSISLFSRLIACSCTLLLSWLALTYYTPLPIFDHFIMLPLLEHYYAGTLSLSDIIQFRGGHWLVSALLIQVPLAIITGWNQQMEALVSLLLLLISAALMCRTAKRACSHLSLTNLYPYVFITICLLVLMPDQAANLFWGWQTAVYISIFALALLTETLTQPTLKRIHLLVAIFAVLLGVYAFSTSFALIPVALFLTFIHPTLRTSEKKLWFVIWSLLIIGIVWHFVISSHSTSGIVAPIWKYFLFVLGFIGASISRFASDLCIPISVTALGCLIYWYRKQYLRLPILALAPFIAWMVYGFGAGALIAYGRIEFGLGQAGVARYIAFSNLFWVGFAGITLMVLLTQQNALSKNQRVFIYLLLIVIFALKIGNSVQLALKNIRLNHRYTDFKERLLVNDHALNQEEIEQMYFKYDSMPRTLASDIAFMRNHKLCGFDQISN